jgi:dipeptidyl aminopeptidase/acylaminoacyl peptidase
MGHSSGGSLVALLATDHSYLIGQGLSPDLVRGVIGVSAGAYDERPSISPTYPQGPFTDVYGDLEQAWNASPLKYVDGTQPPFLVLYGSNDNPGFADDSTAFYQALVDHGSEAQIHMIPGRNHQMMIGDAARPGDPVREYVLQFVTEHTK